MAFNCDRNNNQYVDYLSCGGHNSEYEQAVLM